MNANLGPVFDSFVAKMLETGLYQSQSEVLREGLRMLKEREEWKQTRLAGLRQAIAKGIDEDERGDWVDGPTVFARIRKKSATLKRARK